MEAAVQTPQMPDFTQLADQLTKLSEFFKSIEDKTKVYADNAEGTSAARLVQAADIVKARQEKKLEKIQYAERKQDAKEEFRIQRQIAKKEYQINRQLSQNVTFEKLHYMKEAFKQSRTHKNVVTAAFSAFITGFSLGKKQTQINRYKKQIALLSAKEEYRQAQQRTLQNYVQKRKTLAEDHKAFMKNPKAEAMKEEKARQKMLKDLDSKPFDIREALDIGLIPKYGTPEYNALPQERKDALKIATRKCLNVQKQDVEVITYKDFRSMVDRYEDLVLVTRQTRASQRARAYSATNKPPRQRVSPNQEEQKTRVRTR